MFDIRSMFLVAALTAFACMIVLWSMRRVHAASHSGLKFAAVAEAFMALALGLIAVRGLVPDMASVMVANTVGTIGGLLIYEAARRLLGAPPMLPLLIGGSLVAIALNGYWGSDPAFHMERICLTSLVQGGTSAAMIPLMLKRRGRDASLPLRWGLAFGIVYASAHFLRLGATLNSGVTVQTGGMVTGNIMIEGMAAFFSIAPMIYAMVLIGIVNGRLAYEFRRLANTDSLTGLLLRREFFSRVDQALARTAKGLSADRINVLLMLDLDHFKDINDRYGHPAGDAVLIKFARLLESVAPTKSLVGRYGGEEFCLMLTATRMPMHFEYQVRFVGVLTRSPLVRTPGTPTLPCQSGWLWQVLMATVPWT